MIQVTKAYMPNKEKYKEYIDKIYERGWITNNGECLKELESRSAIYWTNELDKNSSLLILCGSDDKRVNPNQAKNIAKKLTEINYNFTLKELKTDHKFSNKKINSQSFFYSHLQSSLSYSVMIAHFPSYCQSLFHVNSTALLICLVLIQNLLYVF